MVRTVRPSDRLSPSGRLRRADLHRLLSSLRTVHRCLEDVESELEEAADTGRFSAADFHACDVIPTYSRLLPASRWRSHERSGCDTGR